MTVQDLQKLIADWPDADRCEVKVRVEGIGLLDVLNGTSIYGNLMLFCKANGNENPAEPPMPAAPPDFHC